MKIKLITLLFLCLAVTSCNSGFLTHTNNRNTSMALEGLNIKKMSKSKSSERGKVTTIVKAHDDKDKHIVIVDHKKLRKIEIYPLLSNEYVYIEYFIDIVNSKEAIVRRTRIFNKQGNILKSQKRFAYYLAASDKQHVEDFNLGYYIPIGIWEEFDADGKRVEITDYDEGYTFNIDSIIRYTQSMSPAPIANSIRIEKHASSASWIINYSTNEEVGPQIKYVRIIIDGKSGEVIEITKYVARY